MYLDTPFLFPIGALLPEFVFVCMGIWAGCTPNGAAWRSSSYSRQPHHIELAQCAFLFCLQATKQGLDTVPCLFWAEGMSLCFPCPMSQEPTKECALNLQFSIHNPHTHPNCKNMYLPPSRKGTNGIGEERGGALVVLGCVPDNNSNKQAACCLISSFLSFSSLLILITPARQQHHFHQADCQPPESLSLFLSSETQTSCP